MSGNIFRWLVEAFNPCVHQWRIVSKLEDSPNNPSEVHVVRECEICGALDKQIFTGPPKSCPPHKWVSVRRSAVWDKENDKFPTHHRVEQNCSRCGEVRSVDLKPISAAEAAEQDRKERAA